MIINLDLARKTKNILAVRLIINIFNMITLNNNNIKNRTQIHFIQINKGKKTIKKIFSFKCY